MGSTVRMRLRGRATHVGARVVVTGIVAVTIFSAMLVVSFAVATVAGSVPPASATTGDPGVPQAPTVVFEENFENGTSTTPEALVPGTGLTAYTGQPIPDTSPSVNETYTGDPNYTTELCDGVILSYRTTQPSASYEDNDCNGAWPDLQDLADALGLYEGESAANAENNHVLGEYTNGGDPGDTDGTPGGRELQTVTQIPVTPGDFYAVSALYGVENCFATAPILDFYLLDPSGGKHEVSSEVDPCDSGITPISVGSESVIPDPITSGTFIWPYSSIGFEVYNEQTSGYGNDSGFDNPEIVNVTPQLDQGFSPSTIPGGQTSTMTFTITNTSDLDAKDGWTFTDTLPSGVVVAATPDAATTCENGSSPATVDATAGGSSISVPTGDLNAGQSYCTVTIDVTASTPGSYTSTSSDVTESALLAPGSASLDVVPDQSDITVEKSAASTTPTIGTDDTFTLVAETQEGSNVDSGQVVVTDTLPSGLTYVSAGTPTDGNVSEAGGTVTWTIPAPGLAPPGGTPDSASLTFTVAVTTSSSVSNTATFTQAVPNGSGGTSGSSNTVSLTPQYANVSLAKTAESKTPMIESDDTFTLEASNSGDADSGQVVVTDPIPASLSYQSSSATAGTVSESDNTVTWTISDLTASGDGSSATLTITVLVTSSSPATNRATFTQTTPDASGKTEGASNGVTVNPSYAVVSLTKTVADARPRSGTDDTYTITVSNAGPDTAKGVVVTDALPSGLSYVSSDTTTGTTTFDAVDTTLTWTVGSLAKGASASLRLVAKVTATGGSISNTASVHDVTYNPKGQTRTAVATAAVLAPATVPPAPTGEPWSSWNYWLLVALLGVAGFAALAGGRRRRRRTAV